MSQPLVHVLITAPGPSVLTWAYQAAGVIRQNIRQPSVYKQGETSPCGRPPVSPVAHILLLQVFHADMYPYVHEPPPSEYVTTILCQGPF